jgi:hypothetical protein
MKNKRQILAYLRQVNIATEKDELAIEAYLSRRSIILKLNKSVKTDAGLPEITLEEFAKWFDTCLPERNEVVVFKDTGAIGIIKDLSVNAIVLGVSLTAEGNLVTSEEKVENAAYRMANTDEKIRLQKELNKRSLTWNNSNSKLQDAVKPLENLQLRVSLLGERVAVGVFREINDAGEIVMYCVKENGKPVRYSLHEVVAPNADYQLEPVSAQERAMLASELEKAGKTWNGHAKRIEPFDFRAQKGEVYYYIDDFLEITATQEKEKPKDVKRLRSGNYYRNRSDAEETLGLIVEHRKKQLVIFTGKKEEKKTLQAKKKKTNNCKNIKI